MMLTILCCYVFSRFYRGGFGRDLAIRSSMAPVGLVMMLLFPATGLSQVAFDVNAMAPARDASQYGLLSRLPNSRFVEASLR